MKRRNIIIAMFALVIIISCGNGQWEARNNIDTGCVTEVIEGGTKEAYQVTVDDAEGVEVTADKVTIRKGAKVSVETKNLEPGTYKKYFIEGKVVYDKVE